MALARLGGARRPDSYTWPGFVDALATLLMVIIFVVLVFVLIQVNLAYRVSGQDATLNTMREQIASLGEMLNVERNQNADLSAELDRITPHLRGTVVDRLSSIFALHYAFETRRTPLFLAHIAAAYNWRPGSDSVPYGRNPRLRGMIHDCVADGRNRGEVADDADIPLIVDTLMAAYAWNYRLAAWEQAGPDRLSAIMEQQIALVAQGFTPAAAAA